MFANVQYSERLKLSAWRKISLGSWRPRGDSAVLGEQKLRMEPILNFIDRWNQCHEVKININHVFAKIFGLALTKHPEFNVVVRPFGVYKRQFVDTFFHVVQNNAEASLSGLIVRSTESKSLSQISLEFEDQAHKIRKGEDLLFSEVKNVFKWVPGFLSKFVLDFTGFISYALNFKLTSFGVPQDPFGSMMITNIGSLGLENCYTIIAPYTRIPVVASLGAIKLEPVVSAAGELEVGKVLTLSMTIDHRVVDGYHIAQMIRTIKDIAAHPAKYLENST